MRLDLRETEPEDTGGARTVSRRQDDRGARDTLPRGRPGRMSVLEQPLPGYLNGYVERLFPGDGGVA